MLCITKDFFKDDQVKILIENLSSKPISFYLRGINKLLDKWQEVIQNKGNYTIDWN